MIAATSSSPAWLDDAVFYEIYPQSFLDSNGDGIGDLRGIIAKLDYIASIGCNAIWLNPCFESPFGDAGYDVSDFRKVAPRYGTNEDLCELFRKCHQRGMHVILDLVAGHTSIDHPWFRASCEPEPNEYSNRYIWTSTIWKTAPPPLQQVNGFCQRDGNYVTNFFHFQPALNYGFARPDPAYPWQLPIDHPDVQATHSELRGIMKFLLELGADGFRVDMASSLIKSDDSKEAIVAFWQSIRSWFDEAYPEAVLVAEWSMPEVALRAGFHIDFMIHFGTPAYTELFRAHTANDQKLGFDLSGHSFFDREGRGNIRAFLDPYLEHYEKTKDIGLICLPTGNHDISRLRGSRSDAELEVALAFLFSMPGVPFIYQGDEIGLRNVDGLPSKEGAYVRTCARTPMQWNEEPNAGFSEGPSESLYLPIDPAIDRPTVEAQEADPNSILNFIRKLTSLRRQHPALAPRAHFEAIYAEDSGYPFVYQRGVGATRLIIVVNPADMVCEAKFPIVGEGTGELIFGSGEVVRDGGLERLTMPPISFAAFRGL